MKLVQKKGTYFLFLILSIEVFFSFSKLIPCNFMIQQSESYKRVYKNNLVSNFHCLSNSFKQVTIKKRINYFLFTYSILKAIIK